MTLLKNSTILITGIVFSNMLAYTFHFIAGRMLGPVAYGNFGALMALFLLVALPGGALGFAVTKYTARFNANNELGKIAILRKRIQNDVLAFSMIIFFIIIIFSRFIAEFLKIDSIVPVILVGITLVFALLLPINNGILPGMKKFKFLAFNLIFESFSRVVLLFVFIYLGYGVNGAILAYGMAYLIAFLMVFPYIKETWKVKNNFEKIEHKPIYRFILQVLIVNIGIQSLLNLPSLFIKHFYTSEFTGNWTAALNLARISLFITTAISYVMFPEISKEKDNIIKRKFFLKAALLVFLMTSGIALFFFFFPQLMIHLLYGKAYLGAVGILKWMGIAMIFLGLLQLRADYFLAKLN